MSLLETLGGYRVKAHKNEDIGEYIPRMQQPEHAVKLLEVAIDLESRLKKEGLRAKYDRGDYFIERRDIKNENRKAKAKRSFAERIKPSAEDRTDMGALDIEIMQTLGEIYIQLQADKPVIMIGDSDDPLSFMKNLRRLYSRVIPPYCYFFREELVDYFREKEVFKDIQDGLTETIRSDIESSKFQGEHICFPTAENMLVYLGSNNMINDIAVRIEGKNQQSVNLKENLTNIVSYLERKRDILEIAYDEAEGHQSEAAMSDFYELTKDVIEVMKELDQNFNILKLYAISQDFEMQMDKKLVSKKKARWAKEAEEQIARDAKYRREGRF